MASMEQQRDIQTFCRNERARSTVSSCSSLGMEIKRKKIRESAVFLQEQEKCMQRCASLNDTLQMIDDMNLLYIRQITRKLKDTNIQEKIDFEVRMREGAYKLLVASTQRDQILSASKNLMTCHTRILGYMTEVQKKKEEHNMKRHSRRSSDKGPKDRIACQGKVAISGLRIPLMWKDSDHFNNRGSSRRVAVFCLMKIGTEVFDTEMVVVDRSMTDICFDNVTIFKRAGPEFELKLEIYSCAMEDEMSLVNTPKKLARKLGNSFSKASGRKLCPLQEGGDAESFFQSHPIAAGSKYNLLAQTTLSLAEAEGTFQSLSLFITQNEHAASWLPLYGNMCCRLIAQPECMTQDMMRGFLNQQQNIGGVLSWNRLYCVLRAGSISCYYTPEEIEAKLEAAIVIPVNKETRIRAVDKDPKKRSNSFTIINLIAGEAMTHVFVADCSEELQDWTEAFRQHLYDLSQWKHCCTELMKIEVTSPRRPPLFLTKQATSVYHDLSIDSPQKPESLTDIIHNKIEETGGRFLIGQEEEAEAPHWAALFEGSCPMVVQKTVLSPGGGGGPGTAAPKKRRAPPPPPGQVPYTQPWSGALQHGKENSWRKSGTRSGRPSLDSKFSAIIQQLQSRKTRAGQEDPEPESRAPEGSGRPVPAPRQRLRSFREKMTPKNWKPSQDLDL